MQVQIGWWRPFKIALLPVFLVPPSSQWKKDDLAAQLERKYMQEYVPIAVSEE